MLVRTLGLKRPSDKIQLVHVQDWRNLAEASQTLARHRWGLSHFAHSHINSIMGVLSSVSVKLPHIAIDTISEPSMPDMSTTKAQRFELTEPALVNLLELLNIGHAEVGPMDKATLEKAIDKECADRPGAFVNLVLCGGLLVNISRNMDCGETQPQELMEYLVQKGIRYKGHSFVDSNMNCAIIFEGSENDFYARLSMNMEKVPEIVVKKSLWVNGMKFYYRNPVYYFRDISGKKGWVNDGIACAVNSIMREKKTEKDEEWSEKVQQISNAPPDKLRMQINDDICRVIKSQTHFRLNPLWSKGLGAIMEAIDDEPDAFDINTFHFLLNTIQKRIENHVGIQL